MASQSPVWIERWNSDFFHLLHIFCKYQIHWQVAFQSPFQLQDVNMWGAQEWCPEISCVLQGTPSHLPHSSWTMAQQAVPSKQQALNKCVKSMAILIQTWRSSTGKKEALTTLTVSSWLLKQVDLAVTGSKESRTSMIWTVFFFFLENDTSQVPKGGDNVIRTEESSFCPNWSTK